jgi:hypothetical protein
MRIVAARASLFAENSVACVAGTHRSLRAAQCILLKIEQHEFKARDGTLQAIGQIRANGSGADDGDTGGKGRSGCISSGFW